MNVRLVQAPTLLRIALPDRPGALASVARCLAACGVDILGVEVVGHEEGEAIDDILVAGGDLARALGALDDDIRVLGRIEGAALPDPGLLMAEALGAVLAAPSVVAARGAIVGAAVRLGGGAGGALLQHGADDRLSVVGATVPGLADIPAYQPSLARRALRAGRALTTTTEEAWAPQAWREALVGRHVVAVPLEGETDEPYVLVVVRESDVPFVAAEIDRLAALLRVVLRRGG